MKIVQITFANDNGLVALSDEGDIYCGTFEDIWAEDDNRSHIHCFRWDYKVPAVPAKLPTLKALPPEPLKYRSGL